MLKPLLIIFCVGLASLQLHGQVANDSVVYDEELTAPPYESGAEEEPYDTILKIHAISISADSVSYWKNKKEFAYMKNLDSLLKASEQEDASKKRTSVNAPDISWFRQILNSGALQALLWMLAGIFVLAVLYNVVSNKGMFRARKAQPAQELPQQEEADILEQDLDYLLQQAEQDADYRLATRYGFLKILQQLKDAGHLDFAPEKTNSMYVREAPSRFRNEFARIVLGYEYIWYGKASLTAEQYGRIRQQYFSFNKNM